MRDYGSELMFYFKESSACLSLDEQLGMSMPSSSYEDIRIQIKTWEGMGVAIWFLVVLIVKLALILENTLQFTLGNRHENRLFRH